MTAKGIPVSCEVDIYGALSEFIGTVVSEDTVTLLDINNSVPQDLYDEDIKGKYANLHIERYIHGIPLRKYSFEQAFLLRDEIPEDHGSFSSYRSYKRNSRGDIVPGDITFFRLQSTADANLRAYIAHGEVLPVATRSFGAIGIFAIPEMGRFYRHVLIEKNFPHHGAVAFGHFGKALYEVFKYIGVDVDEIEHGGGCVF